MDIKKCEDEIDKLDQEYVKLTDNHTTRLEKEMDVGTLINYANYFLEHLDELLFRGSDTARKGAMFGLLFQRAPTYKELTSRTPNLSPLFELNRPSNSTNNQVVSPLSQNSNSLFEYLNKFYWAFGNYNISV